MADKNNNGRYDEGEKIAYLPAPIAIAGSTGQAVPLVLTQPDHRPPLLTTRTPSPTQMRFSFNEGLRTATLAPLAWPGPAAPPCRSHAAGRRGRNWCSTKPPAVGDGRYLLTATDSTGNVGHDTLQCKFPVPGATAKKAASPSPTPWRAARARVPRGPGEIPVSVPVRVATGRPSARWWKTR